MKKVITIFISIVFCILISNNVFAYDIREEYMLDPYTIEDYNELVNLYDELRGIYEKTCEDASSYEQEIQELKSDLEDETKIATNNNTATKIVILAGIVIIVAVIYVSNK